MASDLEIPIAVGETRAFVAPNRGGMASRFDVDGRPVFFLDRASFADPTKNVRGGSPVLFPTPGKLASDRWARDGRSGALGQHGFARNRAWKVLEARADAITLADEADEGTRAAYPWDYAITLTYRVTPGALRVDAVVSNRSADAMPFGLGLHPYFAIADKSTFTLASDATRAFDNVAKRDVPFDARTLALGDAEIDLHLRDHEHAAVTFACDGRSIVVDTSVARPQWVLWSVAGRDFVCVEPWSCPGDAMNGGDRLLHVAPGASMALSFGIRVQRP